MRDKVKKKSGDGGGATGRGYCVEVGQNGLSCNCVLAGDEEKGGDGVWTSGEGW